MNKVIYGIGGVVIGLVCMYLAIVYWTHSAGTLPQYLPGFEVGSDHIHIKHGVGVFILGLGAFAFAWFQTGNRSTE